VPNVNGINNLNHGVTGQPAGSGVGTAIRNQPQS
jgi:hypothetical protein